MSNSSQSNSRQSNRSSSSNYRSASGNNNNYSAKPVGGSVARLPCCPHCTNVNKFMNKNLPTDHWLRETADPASQVVCKELMATECRFCHNLGHTRSQCPQAQAQSAQSAKMNIVPIKPLQSKPSGPTFKSKNVFDDLDNSDDEKPVVKVVNKPVANANTRNVSQAKVLPVTKKAKLDLDFPAFGLSSATTSDQSVLNFAKAIMAPALPTVLKVAPEPVKESVKSAYKPISIAQKNRSWLDSDSGEDDLTEEYIALQRAKDQDFATQCSRVNSTGTL